MKIESLLRIPIMEDGAIEGVLFNTGLYGVNADYVCSSFDITPTLSDEEKRDLILPIIQKANPFGDCYDQEVYEKLVAIANSVKKSKEINNNIVSFEEYGPNEYDDIVTKAR